VNRRGDGVEKTLTSVRREVNSDMRSGSDRACDFYIEHYFAIGTIRIARRRILSVGYGYSGDFGLRIDVELFEISGQIGMLITTTQFDQRDRLPGTISG
jgi:hypothetical protein